MGVRLLGIIFTYLIMNTVYGYFERLHLPF